MIIGVAGPYASGKSEVVAFLRERGFAAGSLSDVIRALLAARGEPETRERMIETGNAVRAAEGSGALARRLLAGLSPDRNHVVDSIRHPAEVAALREADGFRLLWLDAEPALRFARLRERARPGDPESLDELLRLEAREAGGADAPSGQQLEATRALADHVLENNGTREELFAKLQTLLSENLYFERPGWDEYFMSIARVVASRSNCVKRRVAALITIDRRVIATGYNGTPRGTRNCNEGGCPRCNRFGPGGAQLGECVCSHAEENAITQSAYHGVSVRGGTLYTTFCPCLICTKMIINAGIAEVVYSADYPLGDISLALLQEARLKVRQVAPEKRRDG